MKIEPFPSPGDPAQLVEIPAFYPSEEEFRDPIKYIQSIHDKAEPFGMCKIVPPLSWKVVTYTTYNGIRCNKECLISA